jgi:hypothetical protein
MDRGADLWLLAACAMRAITCCAMSAQKRSIVSGRKANLSAGTGFALTCSRVCGMRSAMRSYDRISGTLSAVVCRNPSGALRNLALVAESCWRGARSHSVPVSL